MVETMLSPEVTESAATKEAPWFSTYNRHIGAPGPVIVYQVQPFPAEKFCANSPWQDHVIVAHFGVEPLALAAGFEMADDYIRHLIASAPKRGSFCLTCPNQKCALSTS